MKPFLQIGLILLFLVSCSTKSEVATTSSEAKSKTVNQESDSEEKEVPYKVLRSAPTVKYNIYKRGDGNKVFFSFHSGRNSFPTGFEIYPSNGTKTRDGKKHGTENIDFPFKCSLYCPTINTLNWNSDMAQQLNDFDIEFYERGNWEVSFVR